MRNIIYLILLSMMITSCQESLEERCNRELKDYTTKNCPVAVDKFTIQDSVTYDSPKRAIHYYYTLSGNADNINNLRNARVILKEQLRNNTSIMAYKDDGFNFIYTYYSKSSGKILIEHMLTKEDYE